MSVPLILRSEKGAPLTWAEADANFLALREAIDANPPIAQPAGGTLTAEDAAEVYTNEGAGSLSAFVLPAAEAGLIFGFIVQDASGLTVTAAAGDTIRIADGSGTSIENMLVGSVVELTAINATEWMATALVGDWSGAFL